MSPAGMAGLAHPQGERLLATAAGQCSIIQMVRVPLTPLTYIEADLIQSI